MQQPISIIIVYKTVNKKTVVVCYNRSGTCFYKAVNKKTEMQQPITYTNEACCLQNSKYETKLQQPIMYDIVIERVVSKAVNNNTKKGSSLLQLQWSMFVKQSPIITEQIVCKRLNKKAKEKKCNSLLPIVVVHAF